MEAEEMEAMAGKTYLLGSSWVQMVSAVYRLGCTASRDTSKVQWPAI